MKRNFHMKPAELNAGMVRLVTFKNFLDLAHLVLREQALLEHDDILIFDTEMDNALGDYLNDRAGTEARLAKMRKEIGLTTKIVGTHVITIDEMEMDDD